MNILLLHVLFFFTGLSSLVYEVLWTRMLGHVVGNTTQAIGLVLAAFMAGLALGSAIAGRLADRRTDPLRLYGILELGIALCALLIPASFGILTLIYVNLHRVAGDFLPLVGGVRFVLAFLVLVVPTMLMGATLPVLSRFAVRRAGAAGSQLATLYGINTLGAMLGAGLTGFVLMRAFGISGTNFVAIGINIAVAAAALLLHRLAVPVPVHAVAPEGVSGATHAPPTETAACDASPVPPAPSPGLLSRLPEAERWVLLYGLSGMIALALEVLWTKSLAFFLGNTTQAFATMLATFLLGLSLGALLISRRVDRLENPRRAMGLCLLGVGTSGLATMPAFGSIMNHIPQQDALGGFLVAAMVMLPATVFMGAMLPLTARVYVEGLGSMARQVGRLYAVNTVGAILGSVLAAFVTIPLLGIQGSILAMCALAVVTGIVVLLRSGTPALWRRTAALAAVAGAFLVFFVVTTSDRFFSVLHYNFRPGFLDETASLYYDEGSSGIVEVTREDSGFISYKIDGENQSKTSESDQRVHNLLSQLGLLLHPYPKDVLMVALGAGMTAGGAVPFDPLYHFNRVDVVEINPAILGVAALFKDYNNDILRFPNLHVMVEDGRNFLLTTPRRYDVIVTGVIHPKYNAGNAGMYGREYYGLVQKALKPGGIVVQWAPVNGLRDSEFRGIIKTFQDAFPHVTLWASQNFGGFARGNNNLILVGSMDPVAIDYPTLARKMSAPSVRQAMEGYGVYHPLVLLDTLITDSRGLAEYTRDAEVFHDDHSPLEFLPAEEHAPDVLETVLPLREKFLNHVSGVPPALQDVAVNRYLISQRLMTADLAADRGQFAQATDVYRGVMARFPGQPDVAEAAREIAFLAKTRLKDSRQAASADPANQGLCQGLAAMLAETRNWGESAAEWRRCRALKENDVTLLGLGSALYGSGDLAGAREAWEKLLRGTPGRADVHYDLALIDLAENHPDVAITHLETAIQLSPRNPAILRAYGKALVGAGDSSRAREIATRLLTIAPADEWGRNFLMESVAAGR
ncbi:MAG: fused MFS/spermidine synthase [Nitrospirota bacterium]|nr:fused MFS/spermidine synthase [Nitrospirota bacterium]